MDIAGAKALKKRLGPNGADDAPAIADVEIAEDAPPVFHWLGVAQPARETPVDDDEPATGSASMFRRLGVGLR